MCLGASFDYLGYLELFLTRSGGPGSAVKQSYISRCLESQQGSCVGDRRQDRSRAVGRELQDKGLVQPGEQTGRSWSAAQRERERVTGERKTRAGDTARSGVE